ncbi:transposon Ty3-I Gag-Pol polyprotein [Trichonephila clavipes]|nr:transposon Ty3-I Gag-Pol polyprotein [Trichonephila clavipes]
MAPVDTLSRPPHCMLIQNSVHLQFLKAQQADDQITAIKTLLETTPHDNYIVKNKLLYKTVNVTDLPRGWFSIKFSKRIIHINQIRRGEA